MTDPSKLTQEECPGYLSPIPKSSMRRVPCLLFGNPIILESKSSEVDYLSSFCSWKVRPQKFPSRVEPMTPMVFPPLAARCGLALSATGASGSLALAGVGSVFVWLVRHGDGDGDGGGDGGDGDDCPSWLVIGDLGNWGEWWLMIYDGFMVNCSLKEPTSIHQERRRFTCHHECG